MLQSNVLILYVSTLFISLLFGLITHRIAPGNTKNMAFLFGQLFSLCLAFIFLPFLLAVGTSTTLMYIIGFMLILGAGCIGKIFWDSPGVMIAFEVCAAGIMFFVFSGFFGIIGG